MDPNTEHQLWSHWQFDVREAGRHVPFVDARSNFVRWARCGFGAAGRARVRQTRWGWRFELVVEGAPAHDADYVVAVMRQFQSNFVEKGWGPFASSTVTADVLAGDKQDGKPRAQMIEVPALTLEVS